MRYRFSWPAVALLISMVLSSSNVNAELENHYSFDDEANVTADSSGKSRDGFLDDLEVTWVNDAERGGVLEFGGNTTGFMVADTAEELEQFTIMTWAYRDPSLCCGEGGANDGLFQVQLGTDDPENLAPPSGPKVIGGWVQKMDTSVWGRVVTEDGTNNSLPQGVYFMEDEVWTHFAYRSDGELFDVVIDGQSEGLDLEYDLPLIDHDTLYVGRQGTETWGGRLDDFRVYSNYLTDEEIQAIMAGEVGMGEPGDFNNNGMLDADDIDSLNAEIRAGTNMASFDLDNSGTVNEDDRIVWVQELKNTYFGDANLDGEFNSADFVAVFQAGEYEDGVAGNSTWGEGDWNGDTEFDSSDFVAAFQGGGFEIGPRPVASVPEPSSIMLIALGLLGVAQIRRK